MARLLLRSRLVNRLWLAPLCLAASGCLFIEPLNEPPVVHLDVVSSMSAHKGEPVYVRADVSDDHDVNLKVAFEVASADDRPLIDCDYALDAPGTQATVTFYRTGMFTIRATTKDRYGSPSLGDMLRVEVTDAPPAFNATAAVMATLALNACGTYTGGQAIPLHFKGSVVDPDLTASKAPECGTSETLTYTWRVTAMPGAAQNVVLTSYDGTVCAPRTSASGTTLVTTKPDSQVCLWTDGTLATDGSYTVAIEVCDGAAAGDCDGKTAVAGPAVVVPTKPDAPACITATSPPAGSYVVDRAQPQTFQVTGVADDLDGFGSSQLSFQWRLWRQSDPVWRVVPFYSGLSYTLDASSFGVGEQVRVRVESVDRGRIFDNTCAVAGDSCAGTTCVPGVTDCFKWTTWNLELR